MQPGLVGHRAVRQPHVGAEARLRLLGVGHQRRAELAERRARGGDVLGRGELLRASAQSLGVLAERRGRLLDRLRVRRDAVELIAASATCTCRYGSTSAAGKIRGRASERLTSTNIATIITCHRVHTHPRASDLQPVPADRTFPIGISGILPLFADGVAVRVRSRPAPRRAAATCENARSRAHRARRSRCGMPRSLPRLIG